MEISINTPSILFPAFSLLMLVYTNRFYAVGALVRELIVQQEKNETDHYLYDQIKNLKTRLRLIKNMQEWTVAGYLFTVASIYLIYIGQPIYGEYAFALAVITFSISLILLLVEVHYSTGALHIVLTNFELQKESDKK
ncbi:DUF2721 domain-containing protein [Flavobacterium sp. LC2016-01]|uniref:DUF2721 domain-containing protein n=1 Tax=Flavobacterium sp. LC2016-01 TaxID=2675876 RepID=UPI0012BAC0D1|nr:DUF2721 domain-containing protein [Flavobacterium sp. LC2016-01]MTH17734.1 DUF2721 domain-containing protein [Flavobacterium sp. LC2016-01]